MNQYDVFYENKLVGVAYVEQAGLYTVFRCQCNFPSEGSYRITAQYGKKFVDLGLCIPDNNQFITKAKIATKKLSNETPLFFALNTKLFDNRFVPVDPRSCFNYIPLLTEAKFQIENNTPGILIENSHCSSSGVMSSQ